MRPFILILLAFFFTNINAQYKSDNILFNTVFPEDLKKELESNPGYLLLDVRSKGENEDTSSFGLNIGRLKNAKNIDVRQLGTRLNEIQGYKDKPVFVYCSHSQRSRRASKMLADSGFTKVFNINGGMTTLIQTNSAIGDLYETKNSFQYLSPAEFCKAVNEKNSLLLDVRSDSSFNGMNKNEIDNSFGQFIKAVHIPFESIPGSFSKLPKDKKIIIADEYADKSIRAANLLTSSGYKNVAVLFDGIFNLQMSNTSDAGCKNGLLRSDRKYHVLSPDEFNDLAGRTRDIAILDTRTSAEFTNSAKDSWRNIGHIKNAINIPLSELNTRSTEIADYKNKPVIIYNFSASADSYTAAATLVANGFTNVNILSGGLFNLRWRAANIKGKSALKDWVVDIPADNL